MPMFSGLYLGSDFATVAVAQSSDLKIEGGSGDGDNDSGDDFGVSDLMLIGDDVSK